MKREADPVRYRLQLVAGTQMGFDGFDPFVPAVLEDGSVLFQCRETSGDTAIWSWTNESLNKVESASRAPVRSIRSHPDGDPISGVAFYADLQSGAGALVLSHDDGLQVLAESGKGYGEIGPLGPTVDSRGHIAFRAVSEEGDESVFVYDGSRSLKVFSADAGQAIEGLPIACPDGSTVIRISHQDESSIIQCHRSGERTVIADEQEFANLGRFPSLGGPEAVVFVGRPRGGFPHAVYAFESNEPRRILELDPSFESLRGALVDCRRRVVFYASPEGGTLGVYSHHGQRFFGLGDSYAETTITDLALNPVSMNSNGAFATRLSFADGSQGIWLATPEE